MNYEFASQDVGWVFAKDALRINVKVWGLNLRLVGKFDKEAQSRDFMPYSRFGGSGRRSVRKEMGKKYFESKEFKKLKKKYDSLLKEEGFKDIEEIDPKTQLPFDTTLYDKRGRAYFSAERDIAEAHWHKAKRYKDWLEMKRKTYMERSLRDIKVWEMYCDGVPVSEMARRFKVPITRATTWRDKLRRNFTGWVNDQKKKELPFWSKED